VTSLPETITKKLAHILAKKSGRGGEFCLPFSEEKLPFAIRETFPAYKKYALEIGCGWGEFTRQWAEKNPETLVIAIEKKLARVLSSTRQQRKMNLQNIRYLILDIAWFFDGIFSADTFDEITVNFPDPWPKARHHKHRFISPEFAAEISRISRAGAIFTFASDNYRYAREAAEAFEQHPGWRNSIAPYAARPEIPGRPQSFFEQVHRAEGAPIYFLSYNKI
jgi:tRNA (guanine-N7-)-methyltransferase